MALKPGDTYTCGGCGGTFTVPADEDPEQAQQAEDAAEAMLGGPIGRLCPGCEKDFGTWAAAEGCAA